MADDEAPVWDEPPYLAPLNDLTEVLEGIDIALEKPERFGPEAIQALADEVEAAARRHGIYEPLD